MWGKAPALGMANRTQRLSIRSSDKIDGRSQPDCAIPRKGSSNPASKSLSAWGQIPLELAARQVDDTRMAIWRRGNSQRAGFTLLELMMVMTVLGALLTIAIPLMISYQLRSKTAEVKTNLGAIQVLEETYYSEYQTYRSANPEPAAIPGSVPVHFDAVNSDFAGLGFVPEGRVYFSYGVAISGDGTAFTADAGADIDADGFVQYWGYANPGSDGAVVAGEVGCDVSSMQPESVGPCTASDGQTVF